MMLRRVSIVCMLVLLSFFPVGALADGFTNESASRGKAYAGEQRALDSGITQNQIDAAKAKGITPEQLVSGQENGVRDVTGLDANTSDGAGGTAAATDGAGASAQSCSLMTKCERAAAEAVANCKKAIVGMMTYDAGTVAMVNATLAGPGGGVKAGAQGVAGAGTSTLVTGKGAEGVCEVMESRCEICGKQNQTMEETNHVSSVHPAISYGKAMASKYAQCKSSIRTEKLKLSFKSLSSTQVLVGGLAVGAAVGGLVGSNSGKSKGSSKSDKTSGSKDDKKEDSAKDGDKVADGDDKKDSGGDGGGDASDGPVDCSLVKNVGQTICEPKNIATCSADLAAAGCSEFLTSYCGGGKKGEGSAFCAQSHSKTYCKKAAGLEGSPACMWLSSMPYSCKRNPAGGECLPQYASKSVLSKSCANYSLDPLCSAVLNHGLMVAGTGSGTAPAAAKGGYGRFRNNPNRYTMDPRTLNGYSAPVKTASARGAASATSKKLPNDIQTASSQSLFRSQSRSLRNDCAQKKLMGCY